jgi:hypothetical protein
MPTNEQKLESVTNLLGRFFVVLQLGLELNDFIVETLIPVLGKFLGKNAYCLRWIFHAI